MPASEFDIIRRYFLRDLGHRPDIQRGIGDDAACIQVPENHVLVCNQVLLVQGTHFPAEHDASALAATAVETACEHLRNEGVMPAWMTLALQLPEADQEWLEKFSRGLFKLASEHDIRLVGGDTTRGNKTICVHVCGYQASRPGN